MSKTKRKRGRDPAVSVDDQFKELKKHKIFDENGELKTGKEHEKMWNMISSNLKNTTGKKMYPHNIMMCVSQNRNGLKDTLIGIEPKQTDGNDSCREEVANNKSKEEDRHYSTFNKLLKIRRNVLYRPSIKALCQYPFTSFYWPQKVVDLIDLCYNEETFVFCLAGNFTEKFYIPNEYESKDIISYIFGCQVSEELIPLLHILTEETSESIFKRFLNEMMRSKCRIPKRIIIEHLLFMIQGVIQCFTKSPCYEELLTDCFTCLQIERNMETPSCKELENTELSIQLEETKNLSSCEMSDNRDDNNFSVREDAVEDSPVVKQNDKEAELLQILPICQTVIDIRSVIMTVKTWDFTNFPNDVLRDCKNFILKVIISMSQSDSLIDFETILHKLLVLLESKYENQLTETFYNELSEQRLSSLQIECELNSTFQIVQSTCESKIDLIKCKTIVDFLKTVRKQVKIDIANEPVGILDNVFFNPVITIKLLELCVEFPVWTKVMDPLYNVTNAGPSSFYMLKDYTDYFTALSKDNCVMPIDEYLLNCIAYTEKRVNYGIRHLRTINDRSNKRLEHIEQDDSHHKTEENWRNLNYISDHSNDVSSNASESTNFQSSDEEEQFSAITDGTNSLNKNVSIDVNSKEESLQHGKIKRKPKKKGTLLNPCPQFDMLQQLPTQRTKKRSLIKNGNAPEKAVKVKSVPIRILTTSTIDSLSEVSVSSFYLITKFQKYVLEESKTSIVLTLIKEYALDLKLGNFYRKRAEILLNLMMKNSNEELYWNNSMAAFIERSLDPSIKQSIICLTCKKETINRLAFITIDCQNLSNENFVLHSLKSVPTRYCTFCGNLAAVECEIEHYLFCDVETSTEIVVRHLNSLPVQFTYNGKNFTLTGVIGFEDGLIQPIKHYVAYCRNFVYDSWTKYDDSADAIEYCTENQLIVQMAILIYIEYELPIAKAPIQHSDVELSQNNSSDVQKQASVVLEDSSHKELSNDSSIIFAMNSDNSIKQLSITELRTSDVPIPKNVVTSTPERQVSINNEVNVLIVEEDNVSLKRKREISKPKRELTWKDMKSVSVSFHRPSDEKGNEIKLYDGRRGRQIIRNGSRQIEKIKIKFTKLLYTINKFINTCATDCIFEILADMALKDDNAIFLDILRNETKNETISAIINYCESFDMHELLVYRSKLLFMRFCNPDDIPKNLVIDCRANVCSLFKSLMYLFPCVTIVSTCLSCEMKEKKTEATVTLNYLRFFESNMIQDLQMLVQEELQDTVKHCARCIQANKEYTAEVCHRFGNYLAIELDFFYEQATERIVLDTMQKEVKDMHENVKNIPSVLILKNKKFLLQGIIEFEDSPDSLMHYIAYSHCLDTNRWTRYNDMLGGIETVQLNEMTHMKIALLLYVAS